MSRLWAALEPLFLFLMAAVMIVTTCRETIFAPEEIIAFVKKSGPETVFVLDSGHGGADGGAVSCRGNLESHINYEITGRTAAYLMLFGGEVTATRESESIDYPADCTTVRSQKKWDTRTRVEYIASVPGAVLLSIHQNCFPSEKPEGLQLLYGPAEGSDGLASALFQKAENLLTETKLRPAALVSENVYLMNRVSCPAVLCECGFLSNPAEEARLVSPEYQRELAMTLALGLLLYNSST